MRFDSVRSEPLAVCTAMLKPWYSNVLLSWTCCMDGNQNFIFSFLNGSSLTTTDRLLRSDSALLSRGVSSRKLIPTSRCMIASYSRAILCKLRGITQPDCIHNLFINSVLNLLTAESDEKSIWSFNIDMKILIGSIASESKNIVEGWYLNFSLR